MVGTSPRQTIRATPRRCPGMGSLRFLISKGWVDVTRNTSALSVKPEDLAFCELMVPIPRGIGQEQRRAARKRKISILKAQGKSAEAIRELNEYLEHYGKAAFCLEELMMTNPHNHLYCEQYAEVKYTQGGLENLELSRKYFAQALKLNNRNMRALFGLYMSASHIAASPKVNATVKKSNVKQSQSHTLISQGTGRGYRRARPATCWAVFVLSCLVMAGAAEQRDPTLRVRGKMTGRKVDFSSPPF
ncbi:unnamed protein product [Coregonus sp. 'balchen']|nr:unnamed protein product [Coregonus sp. 'balchen']